MLKQLRQSSLVMSAGLTLLLVSCTTNKIILYPITNRDICLRENVDCDMNKMDIGMSYFYLNEVLQSKIADKR